MLMMTVVPVLAKFARISTTAAALLLSRPANQLRLLPQNYHTRQDDAELKTSAALLGS